jgi:hypothetical protein
MKTRIGKRPSSTPYSPLAIDMLLHFFAVCTPYKPGEPATWPPAQREVLAHFQANELIQPCTHGFQTTEKGDWLARQLTIEFKRLLHGLEAPV